MTPAERIAESFTDQGQRPSSAVLWLASQAIDALCLKGERVVLDRTGDTDRLVKQRKVGLWSDDNERFYYGPELPNRTLVQFVWIDSDGAS